MLLTKLAPVPRGLVRDVRKGLLSLTAMQGEVALALLRGLSDEQIADQLGAKLKTVQSHILAVLKHCKCRRTELLRVVWGELADDQAIIDHLAAAATFARSKRTVRDTRR